MAELPFLPIATDAYLADTRHLSTLEHGAYLLLLIEAWRRPSCSLPDDEALLARLAGLSLDEWRQVAPAVMAFWTRCKCMDDACANCRKGGCTWTQKRLTKERSRAVEISQKRKEAADRRWKEKKNRDANAMQTGMQNESKPDAPTPTPTPTPTLSNYGPYGPLSSDDDATPKTPDDPAETDETRSAVAAYNRAAEAAGWPRVQVVNKQRLTRLKARLRDAGGLKGWDDALAKARASPHCCGQNERGWTANFDFLTNQTSFAKLMEGNYDQRAKPQTRPDGQRAAHADPALANIARIVGLRRTPRADRS